MAGWGIGWVNLKILSAYINEYELLFFRNVLAIIVLIFILIYIKKSFYVNLRSLLIIITASIMMVAYVKFSFLGTKLGTASLGGALISTLVPIITFIINALISKQYISKNEIIALCLGTMGVAMMLNIFSFSLNEILSIHNVYYVLASFVWSVLSIISAIDKSTSPVILTFYIHIVSTFITAILFVDFNSIEYTKFDGIFYINLLCLSLITTAFATTIYFIGTDKLGAKKTSSFILLTPFFAILFSVLFLNEQISFFIIVGCILTTVAVIILNSTKKI